MKSFSFYLLSLALLAFLGACGKNNESGKNSWQYGNPYGTGNPYVSGGQMHPLAQQIAANYPCATGYQGQVNPGWAPGMGYPQVPTNGRILVQIPLTNSTFVNSVQPYVGVTSYGDIATIVSTGPNQPPVFYAYLCPRGFSASGTGQLASVKVGANALRCKTYPPITAATLMLPGGLVANFRSLDGGAYTSCGMAGMYLPNGAPNPSCDTRPFQPQICQF